MSNTYILKNANYDGYNQSFSEIGNWNTVLKWATDGSIKPGDTVYKLAESRQPKLKEK